MRIVLLILIISSISCTPSPSENSSPPIPIKVVVVTMFERGEDSGDQPGEFQFWVDRLPLNESLAFPQGYRDLKYNPETGVLGIVTGVGTLRSAASIMALGMDPRFDLTKAYWVVAGIAGVDPEDASVGSAIWAEWVIDGDLAHEIDAREIPADWSTGIFPLGSHIPYEEPVSITDRDGIFHLNPVLVEWAYQLTKDTDLPDQEALQMIRKVYENYPQAQTPPQVLKGDQLAAMTFWHGKYMNDWANQWVKYWTQGKGNYVTTAMEDTGTLQALMFLDNAGKVDMERALVLRTASNFSMPHDGITAAESMKNENNGYSAYVPSLEAAWLVGSKVVKELTNNWSQYAQELPTSKVPSQ